MFVTKSKAADVLDCFEMIGALPVRRADWLKYDVDLLFTADLEEAIPTCVYRIVADRLYLIARR